MTGQQIGALSVGFGLVCFGIVYNQAITWARRSGWMEPYTALWVALGVAVTLIGVAVLDTLVDLNAGLLALIAFACTGSPMIIGDAARYVSRTNRHLDGMRNHD